VLVLDSDEFATVARWSVGRFLSRNDAGCPVCACTRHGFARWQVEATPIGHHDISPYHRPAGFHDVFAVFRKTLWQPTHDNTPVHLPVSQCSGALACSEYVEMADIPRIRIGGSASRADD
jgi:hypothetical protein